MPLLVQALGATAGLVALVTGVGGALLWIRFTALGLPADQSVAMLPKALLLIVGLNALVGPLVVGLLVLLIFVLLDPVSQEDSVKWTFWVFMSVVFLGSLVAVVVLIGELDSPQQGAMVVAFLLAATAIVVTAYRSTQVRHLAWVVLAAFVLCGSLLVVLRTQHDPRMEPVAILLKDRDRGISGFFVGQTSDRFYFAPLPGSGDPGDPFADVDVDRVISVPRDETFRVAMREPVGIKPEEAGREQAQSLLADLQSQQNVALASSKAEVVTTVNPVAAFAPLVNLHSRERAWPMSVDAFLKDAVLVWHHHNNCAPFVVALGEHTDDRARLGSAAARRFSPASLGHPPLYEHPAADGRCHESHAAGFSSTDHTRPYDTKGRPAGLDPTEGFALDLAKDKRGGQKRLEGQAQPQTLFVGVPVYFERQPEMSGGRRAERITYWFFYGLSQPPGPRAFTSRVVHEGDWERVSVLLRAGAGADKYIPMSVRFHFHDGFRDVPWYATRRVGAGGPEQATHPVVFSAVGSHASYPRAGRYENVFIFKGRRRFAVFDEAIGCPRCPQWQTWKLLLDARQQPWYGYGGSWGQVGGMAGTTGPLGPSPYKTKGLVTTGEQTTGARSPVATGGKRVDDRVLEPK
jgi:hypothetical protein